MNIYSELPVSSVELFLVLNIFNLNTSLVWFVNDYNMVACDMKCFVRYWGEGRINTFYVVFLKIYLT